MEHDRIDEIREYSKCLDKETKAIIKELIDDIERLMELNRVLLGL